MKIVSRVFSLWPKSLADDVTLIKIFLHLAVLCSFIVFALSLCNWVRFYFNIQLYVYKVLKCMH